MRYVKSCGFVAYACLGGENRYLIIKSTNGDVGFPKGHVEEGEEEIDTAIRELYEETNVSVRVVDGFRYAIEYPLPSAQDTVKQSVYFLGRCDDPEKMKRQESEVSEIAFLSYGEALSALTFNETKDILRAASSFIEKLSE